MVCPHIVQSKFNEPSTTTPVDVIIDVMMESIQDSVENTVRKDDTMIL